MGYRMAILPGLLITSTIAAVDNALAQLKKNHIPPNADASVASNFRRFGADEWDALRTRFNAGAPIG